MKFNTKVRYGIRAMLEISLSDQETGIHQKDIAKNQEISFKYLDPIIASLKSADLITNVSGKKSGYKLARKAEEINMLHIYEAFDSRLQVNVCLSEEFDCNRRNICSVKDFWGDLNSLIIEHFESTSLADIREKSEKPRG